MLSWGILRTGVVFIFGFICSFLLPFSNALANQLPDITVGPEFEFSRPAMFHFNWIDLKTVVTQQDINPGASENQEVEKFRDEVIRRCAGSCVVEKVPGKFDAFGAFTYKVTFSDGFYFKIEPDVFVVEITAKPMKLSELKDTKVLRRYQEFVFDVAKSIGLTTSGTDNPMSRSAGHFNFGMWSAFEDRGKDFLRYFVDRCNFAELSMGGFYKDYFNAPPMSVASNEQHQALRTIIDRVEDPERFEDFKPNEVAKMILDEVYTKTFFYNSKPYHFQAMGLKNAVNSTGPGSLDRPMEHRDQKMQESIYEFLLLAELVQLRLGFLRTQHDPIVYVEKVNKPSPEEIASAFYVYVTEAGGDHQRFKSLLLPSVRDVEPNDFVQGKVNWSDPKFVESIQKMIPQMMSSVFLRERFFVAVDSARGAEVEVALQTVRALEAAISDEKFEVSDKMRLIELLQKIRTLTEVSDFVIPKGWLDRLLRFQSQYGGDSTYLRSCQNALM